ncbi:MAG: hypothetical protein WD512_05150 [Candidatus Paceibacterota bacterium]
MKSRILTFLLIFIGFYLQNLQQAAAQENQLIPLSNNVYQYIQNLQQRGWMLELNPTSMPYTKGEVFHGLRTVDKKKLNSRELFWYEFIIKETGGISQEQNKKNLYAHAMLEGGFDLNNTLRQDGIRALSEKPYFLPNGGLQLYAEGGNFGGQFGLRHDLSYYFDPDGILPYGHYYVRSEDFFFGYNGDYLQVYYGRFKNQWGLYEQASSILGTNPYPYDNISFSFGNNKLSVEGVFGELDNLGFNDKFGWSVINGERRFLAVHRINWRPSLNFQLSLVKAALYSSNNSSFSLKYYNPFNELFFDRTGNPVNDYSNTFIGGFLWFNKNKVTLNGQLMLDDIHITNDNERITLSVVGSLNIAEMFNGVDVGLESELISYQSYNTNTQKSGRYVYLKRGLATNFNDYILNTLYGKIYAYDIIRGLVIEPNFSMLLQGEQTINQPFYQFQADGSLPNVVLTGTVERTYRSAVRFLYNPIPQFWIDAEVGFNKVNNKSNIAGVTENQITGSIVVGFRISVDGLVGDK